MNFVTFLFLKHMMLLIVFLGMERLVLVEFFQLVIIPIIIGIVEVFKRAGLPNKYSPVVSLLLGVIFGILYVQPLLNGIIVGLMVGLSATGLYSGSKNIFKNGTNGEKE